MARPDCNFYFHTSQTSTWLSSLFSLSLSSFKLMLSYAKSTARFISKSESDPSSNPLQLLHATCSFFGEYFVAGNSHLEPVSHINPEKKYRIDHPPWQSKKFFNINSYNFDHSKYHPQTPISDSEIWVHFPEER